MQKIIKWNYLKPAFVTGFVIYPFIIVTMYFFNYLISGRFSPIGSYIVTALINMAALTVFIFLISYHNKKKQINSFTLMCLILLRN